MASRADRGGDAVRAGDLVSGLFGRAGARSLSAAQAAARAWYAANGDREREHTTGVWLRKSGRAGMDPVMVVEVDAGWLAVELSTNKDLYLQRLAFHGVRVSDIRFQVGRGTGARRTGAGRDGDAGKKPVAPPRRLTDEEEARVRAATDDLPDGLREAAARAMRATMGRRG